MDVVRYPNGFLPPISGGDFLLCLYWTSRYQILFLLGKYDKMYSIKECNYGDDV